MTRSRLTRSVLLLSCVATALIASCGGETPVEPRVARPMTGTYDFTTVLDTFAQGIPVGAPGCPTGAGYCSSIHADSSGRLAGTFQVGDSVGTFYIFHGVYVDVAGAITGVFQGQNINDAYPTGVVDGPVTMSDDRDTVSISLLRPDGDVVDLLGTVAGDSIVGRVRWGQNTNIGPAAPWYTGTFVAHRRP